MNYPIPPAFAISIAIFASVTVSIADDKNGADRRIFLLKFIDISVSIGKTFENLGKVIHRQKLELL